MPIAQVRRADPVVGAAGFSTDPGLRPSLAHLFRRAGFGATSAELDAAVTAGYAATVEQLLTGPDPAADAIAPPTLTQPPNTVPNDEQTPLVVWWLQRMVASTCPLREKLPWYWHGHLTSDFDNVGWPYLMYAQNQLFRTAGWGNFETLVRQVTTDPAMLQYLDLVFSSRTAPNENYAREVCELFVLGRVDASGQQPYTEDDVEAAARALTGWTMNSAQVPAFNAIALGRRHEDLPRRHRAARDRRHRAHRDEPPGGDSLDPVEAVELLRLPGHAGRPGRQRSCTRLRRRPRHHEPAAGRSSTAPRSSPRRRGPAGCVHPSSGSSVPNAR